MSEVITLSSDDEQPPPKKRKPELITILSSSSKECVVLSDDDESVSVNHKENNVSNGQVENGKTSDSEDVIIIEKPSTSAPMTVDNGLFQEFVDTISRSDISAKNKKIVMGKVPVLQKLYSHTVHSDDFNKKLEQHIKLMKESSENTLMSFKTVYLMLKFEYKHKDSYVPPEVNKKIKKFDSVLKNLRIKIRQLEEAEVDLDDDDSAYIQLQRYKDRAAKVFEKLCTYVNEDPHFDHLIYAKLNFSKSRFPEFNKCINKKYKNNNVFPTCYMIDKLLRKCASDHGLSISEGELNVEIQHCFKELGELLQKRRRADLYDVHLGLVGDNRIEDPADKDVELTNTLKNNKKTAETRIAEVVNEFVIKQENGDDPQVSSDSEDSNHSGSENEVHNVYFSI